MNRKDLPSPVLHASKSHLVSIGNIKELDTYSEIQGEYAEWVRARLAQVHACCLSDASFDLFRNEIRTNFSSYSGRLGRFFLTVVERGARGMAGLKYESQDICELKRLYVSPPYRRAGLGRLLVERLLDEARMLGYGKIRIETLDFMVEAIRLYESLGFVRTAQFKSAEGRGYGIDGHEMYFALDLHGGSKLSR